MEQSHKYFELRRRIDDLVYEFDLTQRPNGSIGYKRRDKDLWINWHEELGWVAWDGESEVVYGKPWDTLAKDQSNFPPEGAWVSMKNEKSYVYDLIYPNNKTI